jgi:hypothetical protein
MTLIFDCRGTSWGREKWHINGIIMRIAGKMDIGVTSPDFQRIVIWNNAPIGERGPKRGFPNRGSMPDPCQDKAEVPP